MKTVFNKEELFSRRGCYTKERVLELLSGREEVTINDILTEKNVNIKDKVWFVFNSCDLTTDEKVKLSNKMAWVVLPVFEEQFPDDKRVRNCLEAIDLFNQKLINEEELLMAAKAAEKAVKAACWSAEAEAVKAARAAKRAAEAAYWAAEEAAEEVAEEAAEEAAYWAAEEAALESSDLKKEEIINLLINYFNN